MFSIVNYQEMHIKTTVKYQCTLIRMANIKNRDRPMYKQTMVHAHHEKLLSSKDEWTIDTHIWMNPWRITVTVKSKSQKIMYCVIPFNILGRKKL